MREFFLPKEKLRETREKRKMKEENKPRADFITSILLVIFSILVLYFSFQMPTFVEEDANPMSAPGIVPGILGALILVFSTHLFIKSILKKGFVLRINSTSISNLLKDPAFLRTFTTFVISSFYAWGLVGFIPFEYATFIYVFFFLLIFTLNPKNSLKAQLKIILMSLLQAVLVSGVVTGIFRYLFLVDLP